MIKSDYQNNSDKEQNSTFDILDNVPTKRLINLNVTSTNRHDVCLVWVDTKMDPNDQRTLQLLNQLNDKVELYNDLRKFFDMITRRQETILLIVSGKCAEQCLRSVHSISAIDAIIIFCASPEKYLYLKNRTYVKVLACLATEAELIQSVHTWIDLKCQTHFYTWNTQSDNCYQLTRQSALFLANQLLLISIHFEYYQKYKQDMLNVCRAYYGQRKSELKHILEFELTYTETDAIMWYTRNSFVHKLINRTLRSFDQNNLHAIAFYIRDLRKQLLQWQSTINVTTINTVYHGLVMTSCDINRFKTVPIGSLISTNGFLSTSRKRDIAMAFSVKKQNIINEPLYNVLLEINLNIEKSPVVYADIGHLSAFPEEGEILFDLGTVLSLQSIVYDKEIDVYTIRLNIATQDDYKLIEKFMKIVKYKLGQQDNENDYKSLIGKLLNFDNQLDIPCKKSDDYSQKFSLFRSSFNNLWHANHDKCIDFLEEYIPWIVKSVTNYLYHNDIKIDKHHSTKNTAYLRNYEPSLARFEPVLYFCLNDEIIQHEREHLSTIFLLQYRRFTSKQLTMSQVNDLLDEFYWIYYIGSDLPIYMQENPRIKFYEFNLSIDQQNSTDNTKLFEQLIGDLLYDLGIFYTEQIKRLSNDQEHEIIAKRLRAKIATCYQTLANETEKIIQRYNREDEEDKQS
ncbi:hypothetical protein I4U23_020383 [Adineta vaga]|nr:hypothetical protein I4U23_020383 [Adineta vaga]